MKVMIKHLAIPVIVFLIAGCEKKEYALGTLTPPADVVITTTLEGQDATHPFGNGSGNVKISVTGRNILGYSVDYDSSNGVKFINLPAGSGTNKYAKAGVNTYVITVLAYGAGASTTKVTKDVKVETIFNLDPKIVANLTGTGSKTWRVDKDVAAHLGVGPWEASSVSPVWYAAGPNEKAACCKCLYTARFTFIKNATGSYSLTVNTPDGAFTKTGALAGGLPGIPTAGDEGCYPYAGGRSGFTFIPPGSGVLESQTTLTSILLDGSNTFIGYGAVQKEYEILSITETTLHLRARGTETGNAWYLKLIAE